MDFLSTGSSGLNRLLGGGLPSGQLCLVYGEASTGKTILAMQCALEAARRRFKIFYIDTEQSFSPNRAERLGSHDHAEQIILFRPDDFREQARVVDSLENMLTKTPTLLIVDSVTGLYRDLEGDPEKFFARDRDLNRQLAQLSALASRLGLWVLLTGQVHSSPSRGEWIVEPVATRSLRHWSNVILRLRQTPRQGVRDCLLEKRDGSEISGIHSLFRITEDGIEDV